jgi:hypothetical protein
MAEQGPRRRRRRRPPPPPERAPDFRTRRSPGRRSTRTSPERKRPPATPARCRPRTARAVPGGAPAGERLPLAVLRSLPTKSSLLAPPRRSTLAVHGCCRMPPRGTPRASGSSSGAVAAQHTAVGFSPGRSKARPVRWTASFRTVSSEGSSSDSLRETKKAATVTTSGGAEGDAWRRGARASGATKRRSRDADEEPSSPSATVVIRLAQAHISSGMDPNKGDAAMMIHDHQGGERAKSFVLRYTC